MSTEIQAVKQEVRIRNWEAEVAACTSSGLTVQQWCRDNGISVKTYYYHLRKVREAMLSENCIVPLAAPKKSANIEINTGDINISVPTDCPAEALVTILKVLKNAE